jgi:ferrochelatase
MRSESSLAEAPHFAVLLLAYGGPDTLDDVEPYVLDVRGGRPTPQRTLDELRARYAAIGGASPLLQRTREQAAALQERLGPHARVYVGMRHWKPYIRDVLAAMRDDGVERAVAIPLAPHFSQLSIGAYERAVEEARQTLAVAVVRQWHEHPAFLDAVAERVRTALPAFPADIRDQVPLLFTAHSLPRRILADGDPYVGQLEASVARVVQRLGVDPRRAHVAFQSAGRTQEPWLEPDAADEIERLAGEGARYLLLCPIGFVSDHLEVLYDVDIEYQALVARLGVQLVRTASLNTSAMLIEALADLATSTATTRGWT